MQDDHVLKCQATTKLLTTSSGGTSKGETRLNVASVHSQIAAIGNKLVKQKDFDYQMERENLTFSYMQKKLSLLKKTLLLVILCFVVLYYFTKV